MPFDEPVECPLCMEPLDIDDMNFYPCTCGYQICRFCWHRIRTDENSLCPACRKPYQEDPAEFKPLTEEELTKIKKERRQKDVARKQKAAENRRHLANIRVVQKNLVFVVGLSNRLADADTLKRHEYFGKYGKIVKVVINSSTSYAGAQGPSASAYITYTRPEDCLRAIQAVNNLSVDGRTLKASLGTTKYCSHFLKGTQCAKSDCMYLHELGEEEASFTKEEMQAGKHQDYEQKLVEQYLTPGQPTVGTGQSARIISNGTSNSPLGNCTSSNSASQSLSNKPTSVKKKSDTGSNKVKEPWPLLSTSKSQPVASSGQNTDSVINSDGLSSSVGSQHESPELNSVVNRRTPSSTCSTTSNPRTPTPEASSSLSPRLPNNSTSESNILNALHTLTENTTTKMLAGTDTSTLLAVRKLPFTDQLVSDDHGAKNDYLFARCTENSLINSLPTEAETDTVTATEHSNQFDKPTVSNLLSDWHVSANQGLPSDDDLGFDPFLESNKGLADMLENETNLTHSPLNGFKNPSLKPSAPLGMPGSHMLPNASSSLFADGIMPSVVPPLLPVVSSSSSPLPPPPPGLSGFPQFPNTSIGPTSQDYVRGSRMLGLMNVGQSVNPSAPMMPSSPVNNMPNRTPYNDPRLSPAHPIALAQNSFNAINASMSDVGAFNTQDLKESLKALLPNASINFAPSVSSPQPFQQSRLRNTYMQQNPQIANRSTSWNGNISHMSSTALDDQFTDPAIVSGCLSTDLSNSPPGSQPHWLKSLQQLPDVDVGPLKQIHNPHQMHSQHSTSGYRPNLTHSRMPFAQNIHINQTGNSSGWPTLTAHNPPPGFPTAFRSTSQNPRVATLES